ncbi:MAG: glycosyltransferase [Solirubrobacteraceae bacterium]
MLGLGWFPDSLGGLDRYYRALFERLPGARAVVIGPARDAPPPVNAVARPGDPLPLRLLAYARAARRGAPGAELIDAHFALYALAPLHSRALRSLPAVFHFHGPWAQESAAAGDGSALRRRARIALERLALRRAAVKIVLSSAFRRLLVERYGVAPWDVRVWPPGVDLERFTPGTQQDRAAARARLGLAGGGFLAVCTRRLVARMGIEHLLDAWAAIAAELPPGSELLIVGEGPLRERLQERREPGVRVLGRVSEERLVDCYRAADVAVVPTVSFEGYGLVVLEAAACGTPSIVTEVGGLPEVAAPLDRSLIVPPADPAALAARLRAAAGGALPPREAARAYAERFDWGALAARHRQLYSRLLDGAAERRRRVVYLDHVARLSGGEIARLRLLPHLDRTDVHVVLAEDGPLAQRLAESGVSAEVLPLAAGARDLRRDRVRAGGASPVALLATAAYVLRLALRLRRLRPDVVHTNSLKSGVYGALAARLAGVPVVWHVRDRIAADYLPAAGVRLIRGLAGRLADAVIANSSDTLATVPRTHRHRAHCVIPDSVELSPQPHAPDPATVTFGMLGRIAPWKGQDLFLHAFAQSFPEGAERAVIVGAPMFGEESYERELHALAERLGVGTRVEFRGFREDIWRELASFDVLVHSSVIPEPFGQVVLEGMAAGLPVIAPDEGGPREVIADGRTGRLFASRDRDALAAALRELGGDAELRGRLGAEARLVLAGYHPAVLAQRLQGVYAELLARP